MYTGVRSSFSYACVLPSSKGCVFTFSVIQLHMNWRKWTEMDGNFDTNVRRKWTRFMIFSGNWWRELSSIGLSLIPLLSLASWWGQQIQSRTGAGNVLPPPARPRVEGPALLIMHDASTDVLWWTAEVSLFMVVLAAFSFSSQMGGYREQK